MLTEAEKERLLEIAEDLIRLKSDSGPGYEKAVGDYIYNFYRELGIAVQKQPCGGFRENITARIPGKDGKPTVIYLGHIDTVPAGDEKLWEGDPFIPQIREGKLYGRGSCDMKGSVACAMYAAEYLTKHGIKPESGLHFVYDVDEENTNIGLKEYLKSPQEADLAIVGEPTGLRLSMGHRGVMAFTVTIYGKSCHAGRADLGKNAIYAAADVIREVRNLEERISAAAQEYVGSPSIHVTYISGGSKVNVIPDKAVLWIDRRLIFGETRESCEREMTGILEKVREEWGCGFSLEVTTYCPPGKADREHPLFCGISNLLKSQGIDSTPKAFEASCEAGMLQEATGIPALIWGPGEIGQAHQADEYIELEQLYKGAELYIKFFTMEDCYV